MFSNHRCPFLASVFEHFLEVVHGGINRCQILSAFLVSCSDTVARQELVEGWNVEFAICINFLGLAVINEHALVVVNVCGAFFSSKLKNLLDFEGSD